jgi:Phage tail protein (Tail_P2_I)
VPPPAVDPVAEELWEAVEPLAWDDERLGWPLRHYLAAVADPFEEVATYVRDTDAGEPGWSVALDVDRAPEAALPWLAQLVGAELPLGLTEAQKRDAIRTPVGFKRGTPAALKAAVRRWLVPTNLIENGGFETATTGWAAVLGTIARVTTQFRSGVASLEVTGAGGGSVSVSESDIEPGEPHELRAWLRNPVGKRVGCSIDWYRLPGGFDFISSDQAPYLPGTGGWQEIVLASDAPPDAASALIFFYSATLEPITFHLDDVSLKTVGRVELLERDGSAYRLGVRTYLYETANALSALAAFRAAKPAGIVISRYELFDDFAIDTSAYYLGALRTISGGVFKQDSTAAGNNPTRHVANESVDTQVTVKVTPTAGANLQYAACPGLKYRADDSKFVWAGHAGGQLQLWYWDGAANNLLAQVAMVAPTIGNSYWLRIRAEGDALVAEWFTSEPTPTSTPATTLATTFSAEGLAIWAARAGQGVLRAFGMSAGATADVDDFTIRLG